MITLLLQRIPKSMKSKIKNLISTIERNETHHCEIFSMKNNEKIRVSINAGDSGDYRGWCYQIAIQPISPRSSGKPYSYLGSKTHIKRILKQWFDGVIELTPCGWSPYAQPAYMFKNK